MPENKKVFHTERREGKMKKIINLDKEFQCASDSFGRLSIETEKYIIEIKGKQLLDIIGASCKKLLRKVTPPTNK